MQITLSQFEQIDGLFNHCLHRPELEQVMAHPLASREYVTEAYFRPEWKLLDACVEAKGLDYVDGFASTIEAAATILIDCLTGALHVADEVEG